MSEKGGELPKVIWRLSLALALTDGALARKINPSGNSGSVRTGASVYTN